MSFGGGSMARQSAAMTSLSVLPLGRGKVIDAVNISSRAKGAFGEHRRDHARSLHRSRVNRAPLPAGDPGSLAAMAAPG
jgi:hypothetical protein